MGLGGDIGSSGEGLKLVAGPPVRRRGGAAPIAAGTGRGLDCPFAPGKHKPIWAPHVDTGDHVGIVNAAKLDLSARKLADKRYHRHSGYPGGLSSESLEHLLGRNPERVVRLAIRGMLPKNRLGRAMIRKLRVYAGPTHPHQAQQPQPRALASKR